MIHRLRTRDLFAFAGEIILSAERRSELQLGGGGATEAIKRQLVALLREAQEQKQGQRAAYTEGSEEGKASCGSKEGDCA